MLCSLDGRVMPAEDASISVLDEGLLRGDGVFEVARVYAGVPYALDEHLERMARSAAGLRLDLSPELFAADAAALLDAAAAGFEGYLRLVATRGGRRIVLLEPLKESPPTIALADDPLLADAHPRRDQVALVRGEHARDAARAGAGRRRGAARDAPRPRARGAAAVVRLLARRGDARHAAARATTSSTRSRAAASWRRGSSPSARSPPTSCRSPREAFLAATTREVHPVHAIDGVRLAAAPGPLTSVVADRVREVIAAAVGA